MKRFSRGFVVVSMLALAGSAFVAPTFADDKAPAAQDAAQQKMLLVGEKAPGIHVEKFLKGDAVTTLETGKVYVLEFWATWCGPCVAQMPHLSEMQGKYKAQGVTFIGTSVWEARGKEAKYDTALLDKVQKFVDGKGEKMAYTVAYDGEAKWMTNNYMEPAAQDGIPASFIVDKEGRIAWIGHPMGMEPVLEKVLAGTWDISKEGEAINKEIRDTFKTKPMMTKLREAWGKQDWAGVETSISDLAAVSPEMAGSPAAGYFNQLMQDDSAKAFTFANKMVDGALKSSTSFLNMVAWTIVDPEGSVENKDLALASKAATQAVAAEPKNAMLLDTLARVYWVKGDKAKAIETQQAAIDNLDPKFPEEMKDQIKGTLDEYKKGTK